MRVPVQKNVDVIGWMIRRYMLQAELKTSSHGIDDEWPLEVAVAVSAHKHNRPSDGPQLVKHRFCANVTEMPDLISALGHLLHTVRKAIVRVRKNQHATTFSGLCVNCHVGF
jgi:hypothetical protein